jgi:hypothetical protein
MGSLPTATESDSSSALFTQDSMALKLSQLGLTPANCMILTHPPGISVCPYTQHQIPGGSAFRMQPFRHGRGDLLFWLISKS